MKKILALLTALVLCLSLVTACQTAGPGKTETAAEAFEVMVDKNGMASWSAVAPSYEYSIVDKDYTTMGAQITQNSFVQLPEGFSVHVCPLYADGSRGNTITSEYFGEPASMKDFTFEQLVAMGIAQAPEETPVPEETAVETAEEHAEPAQEEASAFTGSMDENGLVSWQPLEGAQSYLYRFVTVDGLLDTEATTTDTFVQAPAGLCVYVEALAADGRFLASFSTEPFGEAFLALEQGRQGEPILDETGLATWEPAEGVTEYRYEFSDVYGNILGGGVIAETSVQVPEGYCVSVFAVMPDGTIAPPRTSEYFGVKPEDMPLPFDVFTSADGYVSWEPVKDAVAYEITYLAGIARQLNSIQIAETGIQLPEHYAVEVRPVYADGTRGLTALSQAFGEPIKNEEYLDDFSAFSSYDMIAAIDRESFAADENGMVSFTAAGPDGQPMRFVANGASLSEDGLVLAPWTKVTALDAIGRIMGLEATFADIGSEENGFAFVGEYTFDGAHSVEDVSEQISANGWGMHAWAYEKAPLDLSAFQPNYISFNTNYNDCDLTLSSLMVYYDPSEKTTPIRAIGLSEMDYGPYLAGEKYDPDREEMYDPANNLLTFMLRVELDTPRSSIAETSTNCITGVPKIHYTVGDLKDAQGNVLDKENTVVEKGMALEVTIGSYTCDVSIPVLERYANARTMHDLIPEVHPEAGGDFAALVVPIAWQDEQHTYDDETMLGFKAELGRVEDEAGLLTDYSAQLADENRFSLSEYYDLASYGKFRVRSFVTDWYPAPYAFEEMSSAFADANFRKQVTEWLYITYPDMDWGRFDRDANGCFDSVIFLNAGGEEIESFVITSFSGGYNSFDYYTTEGAGSAFRPTINQFIAVHEHLFRENTLVHEFGHTLGLVDYYDVTYSGGNAVGEYDMQSSSAGDWNAYSKYAAGWIEPVVVKDLAPGESVEVTIGSMALTGDAIVIPAAEDVQDGTPFNEYVMIDLFTDDGLHVHSAKDYGLDGQTGVRIYHVNANMERRELTFDMAFGEVFPIGTVKHTGVVSGNTRGRYLIELVQRGGDNTFTDLSNLRSRVQPSDLFRAGDVFTAEDYDEFFFDGLMDSGLPFGYTVEIVSVDEEAAQATVRITRS